MTGRFSSPSIGFLHRLAIRLQICSPPGYVFCAIRMPVIVPAKPVMAAKTSLFHAPKSARCAISMAVRLKVRVMANFTPSTRRSLGSASAAACVAVLSVVFRVKARLIQSVMVSHPLLPQAAA